MQQNLRQMNGLTLSAKMPEIRQQGGEAWIEMKEVEGVLQSIQSRKFCYLLQI